MSEKLYCSFCGKSQYQIQKMVAGQTAFICNECVEVCVDICREDEVNRLAKKIAASIIWVMRFFQGKRGEEQG